MKKLYYDRIRALAQRIKERENGHLGLESKQELEFIVHYSRAALLDRKQPTKPRKESSSANNNES